MLVRFLRSRKLRWILHGILAVLGGVGMYLLVRLAGPARLAATIKDLAAFLPIVFALEGLRIASDAWRTQLLYRRGGRTVPWRRLLPVQIASYPLNLLVPAGGAAAEAFKAAKVAQHTGASLAAATATINHALLLFASFLISVPCFFVCLAVWGWSALTIAVGVQALTGLGLGLFIQTVSRQRVLGNFVGRFSTRVGNAVGSYQGAVARLTFVPLAPLGAAFVNRLGQLAQVGLLAFACGAGGGATPILAFSVQLVGGAAGDFVPAQIGVTDGSFALAAGALGLELAQALSIPLALHAVQLLWAAIGIVTPTPATPARMPSLHPEVVAAGRQSSSS